MDDRIRTKGMEKGVKLIRIRKKKEAVNSHDPQHPEVIMTCKGKSAC